MGNVQKLQRTFEECQGKLKDLSERIQDDLGEPGDIHGKFKGIEERFAEILEKLESAVSKSGQGNGEESTEKQQEMEKHLEDLTAEVKELHGDFHSKFVDLELLCKEKHEERLEKLEQDWENCILVVLQNNITTTVIIMNTHLPPLQKQRQSQNRQ